MFKMPVDRHGVTYEFTVGDVSVYVTVNRDENGVVREAFGKATEGHQGEVDGLCLLISLLLRENPDLLDVIIAKLRHRVYLPEGCIGQPKSLSDAIAIALEKERGDAA